MRNPWGPTKLDMEELILKKTDQAGETLEDYFGSYALVSK